MPFEAASVHLLASLLNLNASYDDLMRVEKINSSYISSYFRSLIQPKALICFINTPDVNSDHGKLSCKALVDEKYDKLIYVFDANRLGTVEELRYLKYISENVPKDKVIFVLNKVGNFRVKMILLPQALSYAKKLVEFRIREAGNMPAISILCF